MRIHYKLLVFTLLWHSMAIMAQSAPSELSEGARISLMTISPGDELYSSFGHSALRVSDPSTAFDRIYNYGTFDFTQPNFYINFCRGKLLYFLDLEPYRTFKRGSEYDKRIVREQVLNLTPEQKGKLFTALEENARGDNRFYKYDFFYDNCATRIRDIVANSVGTPLRWENFQLPENTTLRDLLRPYLRYQPWTQFGIDLVLGMPTDKVAGVNEAVFLPDFLHDAFKYAKTADGKDLVSVEHCDPQFSERPKAAASWWSSPLFVLLLIAGVGAWSFFNSRVARVFDPLFYSILGFAGLIIAFLWFATDHGATQNNLNLFWALPTHLLFFWRAKAQKPLVYYHTLLYTGLALSVLAAWTLGLQEFPLPVLPIVLLLVAKGVKNLRKR